jgi:D-3-phosphoglycerate dehydrogenase / 2-oxoglutarate reductase
MRILIADKLDTRALKALRGLGFVLDETKGLPSPENPASPVPAALPPAAEILIVRSTLVPASVLPAFPALKLIIRAGAGTDTIDVAAARARGIQVSNTPGRNADAVAEIALGLLLAADRRLPDATRDLRAGKWTKAAMGQGMGLQGRTLGLVGLGAVGRAMARNCRGLGMKVVAWSDHLTPALAAEVGVEAVPGLIDLARASDAVSVHVASTPATRGLIGADFFANLRPGALFVNTARGEVVDRGALVEAIRNRGLRAGLDVFAGEPKTGEAPFADVELASLCACSPHLGASTDQAAEAVADEVVRIASAFRETGQAPNAVDA